MTLVGNFYFSIFLRLTWEFLGLESERGGSVCWPNNKIIDVTFEYSDTDRLRILNTRKRIRTDKNPDRTEFEYSRKIYIPTAESDGSLPRSLQCVAGAPTFDVKHLPL